MVTMIGEMNRVGVEKKLKELKELAAKGYRFWCRGALCPPVPVRKIARGEVRITEEWCFRYTEISSDDCWLEEGDKACEDCSMNGVCNVPQIDEGSEEKCVPAYALDLGTSGVAGQGYDEEEHWYFSESYEVDHERKAVFFATPLLGGFYYETEDRFLNGYRRTIYEGIILDDNEIIDLSETWKPRTRCGCI